MKKLFTAGFVIFVILSFAVSLIPAIGTTQASAPSQPFPEVVSTPATNTSSLQTAPLNPDFVDYIAAGISNGSYGYMPPPMDLSLIPETTQQATIDGEQLLGANPGLSYFDWRNSGKVTSVKDQGTCGTCWVFATIAALESDVLINENTSYDFSEQSVICCTDPSFVALANDHCNGGGNSLVAADTLIKKGARLESCQPYNTGNINTQSCNDSCASIEMLNGYRLVTNNGSAISKIKDAIYDYGPVSVSFCMDEGPSYPHLYPGNIYYWPSCSSPDNHGVCIVGWNDSIAQPGGGHGAWIVKNSWGPSWGNSGYFYLCYGSGNMQGVGSYRYKDYNPGKKLYYWDESGMITTVGTNSTNSAWMASVFTSTQNGYITDADFWVPSSNAQYQLYIYNGNFGTLLTSQNGSCSEAGYYSIPLNSSVHRNIGQQFTVAVKMTTPGYNGPIAVEKDISSSTINPPIQSGVSFVKVNDSDSWDDAASSGWNVCLRAGITDDAFMPITFPDPGLDAAVRAAINKSTGDIYQSDLDGLTSLNASFRNISDLSGIEYCTNLTSLDLGGNQISDISALSNLTSLQTLELGSNQISDISGLSNLSSLQILWLGYNNISDIATLSGFTNLPHLELESNQISNISALSGLANLETLDLESNQISNVSALSGHTNLNSLCLDSNNISNISALSTLVNLTSLSLRANRISNTTAIQNMSNLIYLSLGTNQISDVSPLSLDTDIEFLDLTNNSVSSIDALSGLLELRTLYLDNNQISDVTALLNLTHIGEGGTKIPLPCKQYNGKCINLGLCDNQISDIQPLVNNSGLGSGDGVDLRCNPLSATSINSYIPALQVRGVTVTYIGPKYTLNLSANAGGTVATPGIGFFTRNCSEIVTLNATANPGYMFVNWSGNTSSVANTSAANTTIAMNGNYSIQANFGLAPTGFYGDADENGVLNLSDYSRVRLMLFGKKAFTPGGDADANGVLNLSDYSRVRLMLFGKKPIVNKYEVLYDFTSGAGSNK